MTGAAAAGLDVFLIRGLVREAGHWLEFGARLADALPGSRVHCLEIPGNGRYFAAPTPLTIPAIVDAVRRDFLSLARPAEPGEKARRPVAFAVSLGGMVLLDWLARHPDDFSSAAIGNTSCAGLSPFFERLRPQAYPGMLLAALTRAHLARERRILSIISNRPELHAGAAERFAAIQRERPVSLANFARQLIAAARYRPPCLAPRVPVLLLNGRGDRLVSPAASERLSRALSLPLRVHPSAGHDLALDAPDWVIGELRAFWA